VPNKFLDEKDSTKAVGFVIQSFSEFFAQS